MLDNELEKLSLEELITELRQIGTREDRMELSKDVESIKSAFYKQLTHLKAGAEQVLQAPESAASEPESSTATEGVSSDESAVPVERKEALDSAKLAELEEDFKKVYADFRKERAEYIREQDIQRARNLELKKQVIEELKALVEGLDSVNAGFPQLRSLQARWKEIGPVPAADFRDLNDTYQYLNEKFYDMVKIDHELRDLDFKKNLDAKEKLCEDAEKLTQDEDVVEAFNSLQNLHEQWKEFGPVAKEYRESIWDRFKAATAVVNKRYQAHFENLKQTFEDNLRAKEVLCEKVEAIAARNDIKDGSEWNALTKEIEQIQQDWKQIGFATRKENQKIYDRFRAACNAFFDKKKEYFSGIKASLQENLVRKEAIVAEAESLKDSTQWKQTADRLIALQKQWREIGPVPRKKSDQLWKRFRAACDEFFAARDKNARPENDFYHNLKAKRALIAEIKACKSKDAQSDAKAKEDFNARWRQIGFVPFKEKDNVNKEFREAMDAAFPSQKNASSEKADLIRRYNTVKQDIATYENNIGFFSNSKNSEPLIRQFQGRIDSAKQELKEIEARIRSLETEQ